MIGIPSIKTITRKGIVPSGWHIAKSGAGIHTKISGPVSVFGFAYDSSESFAIARSRYEVMERLFAFYDVFIKEHGDMNTLPVYHWWSHECINQAKASNVLLGHPLKRVDANGLAWHTTREGAINNALCELLERHQLTALWYKDLKLIPIAKETLEGGYISKSYTSDNAIPFIVDIICSKDSSLWLCGSAVSLTMKHAAEKARREALMLLDGLLSQDSVMANNPRSRDKISTLRDPFYSEMRQAHFENKVIQKPSPSKFASLQGILSEIPGISSDQPGYCLLKVCSEGMLVRGILPNTDNPKAFEYRQGVPLDPFC